MQLVIEGSSISEIKTQVADLYFFLYPKADQAPKQPTLPEKAVPTKKKSAGGHPLKISSKIKLGGKIKTSEDQGNTYKNADFITPQDENEIETTKIEEPQTHEAEEPTQDSQDDNEAAVSGSSPGTSVDAPEASDTGAKEQGSSGEEELQIPKKKVQELLQKVFEEKGLAKARAVLDGFGYRVLREVPENMYPDIVAKCKKVLKS